MDIIEREAREYTKNYYYNSPQVKTVKLINKETEEEIICECGNKNFKFYRKWGGPVLGKRNKLMKNSPIKFNFVCSCGRRLILLEEEFKYGRIRYGCAANKCPFGKEKMNRECISCKYIYEK